MSPRRSLLFGLCSLAAVAGLAAGCGGGDDDAEVASSGSHAAETTDTIDTGDTTSVSTDPGTTDPPVTASPTTATPTTGAPEPDVDGACLVGDWIVSEDQMNAFYGALVADSPVTITVVGTAPLWFAPDGTYGWAPDFALTLDVAGQVGTGVAGGTITGHWTASDSVVTTSSEVNAMTLSVTVGGRVVDGSSFGNGLLNQSPVNGVTYSCDGSAPVLNFMTGDPGVTVPITLQAA